MQKCIVEKNVLNIDLNNFFDEFNFGRVRGFFIINNNFQLTPEVATTIAQIACYKNKLPQGSPASPVITNLITHILDVRLSRLAKKEFLYILKICRRYYIFNKKKNISR